MTSGTIDADISHSPSLALQKTKVGDGREISREFVSLQDFTLYHLSSSDEKFCSSGLGKNFCLVVV